MFGGYPAVDFQNPLDIPFEGFFLFQKGMNL